MDYPINSSAPLTMHIDLNSAFAMIEQQANPLLRGVPVGVAANASSGGCVISPSYEAKYKGIKVGYRVRDAKALFPDIRIISPDPDKYYFVHKQFSKIFREYSPNVVALSVDEAVIKFDGTLGIHGKSLEQIGYQIKQRLSEEIGEWVTCNVGIGTNRFLAKLAASLHKPNGLDIITGDNLLEVYDSVSLMDLCGINTRYKARLYWNGIYTPREFFEAPLWKLWRQVFKSVNGYHWYMRLRGWEVDQVTYGRKSYGQSYALHHFSDDDAVLGPLMMKLCEKMARRLRRSGNYATGISIACGYRDYPWWGQAKRYPAVIYATTDCHTRAMALMAARPKGQKVTHLSVTCFGLKPVASMPLSLFETDQTRQIRLADALDLANNKFGEYVVHSASMHGLEGQIIKRVPFHATADTLAEMYSDDPSDLAE